MLNCFCSREGFFGMSFVPFFGSRRIFANVIVYIFSSLSYDLTHTGRGRMCELNAKVERAAIWKQYGRTYQPSKTAKLLCGKKVIEPYIFLKFRVFSREFLRTIRCSGLKFSEITETVILFQYSEFLFY